MHPRIYFSYFKDMAKGWRFSRPLKLNEKRLHEKDQDSSLSGETNTYSDDAIEPETPVPEVAGRLAILIEALNVTQENVEPSFLQLGQNIQAILSNAAELKQGTIKTVNFVGGASSLGITSEADQLVRESLDQVKGRLDDAVKHHGLFKTYMEGINTSFSENFKLCEELKSTARYLKMVGTNMQIECSRSEQAMETFSVVAQEIRELSAQFLEISKNIRDVSEQAQSDQDSQQKVIFRDLNTFFKFVEDAEKTAKKALEEVESIISLSIEAIEQAEEHSKKISAQVAEIVMLIQFHDNMRQRIEHVAEAALDVEKLSSKDSASEGADSVMTKNLCASHLILNVQTAQMQKIIDDIHTVYLKGEHAFKDISCDADGFLNSLLGLETSLLNSGGSCRVGSMGPFETMESEMARLGQIAGMGANLLQNMHKAFSSVIETASGLSSHTDHVLEISSKTHLTAINAKVMTEKLGENGKALNKLAEEVIDISKQSEGFMAKVEKLQNLILTSSRDMEAQLGKDSGELQSDVTGQTDFTATVGTVSESFEQFKEELSDLSQRADALQELVLQTDRQFAFIPALAEEITHSKDQLEDLCQDLSQWGNMDGVRFDDEINKVLQRYTMQEEREIAERQLILSLEDTSGSNDAGPEVDISEEGPCKDDEFGNDIELF